MTLREFLLKDASSAEEEKQRRQRRTEWVAAINRLFDQLRNWLKEAGVAELLDLELLTFERREQGLGTYHVKGLAIHFGERTVKVLPIGRNVLAQLGPFTEVGIEKAQGRVDVTNGVYKYYLYRKLTADAEEWFVQDERGGIRPFDRVQFETILQELLS